ncbi:MAG: DUF4434 domain-containing protein [Pirellulaceae bacterium]|nr:DUF4434 domain-containing protein [Pirellulaceae bacterium]
MSMLMLLKTTFNRRKLLGGAACLGASALTALAPAALTRIAGAADPTPKTKPIKGSWISVLRNECRHHHYWNDACAKFSRRQWEQSVRDCADLGMEYLVLLATVTAAGDNAFFDTNLTHKAKELACGDPIEAMLSAADDCGVKFFISTGFYGGWVNQNRLLDPTFARNRFRVMAQVAEKFAHHKSFYGWYLPDEPPIEGCFNEKYIEAVKLHAGEARRLVPRCKILIAPYGTQSVVCDDKYVKQLERIDVDIIAYQDVVGLVEIGTSGNCALTSGNGNHHDVPRQSFSRNQLGQFFVDSLRL